MVRGHLISATAMAALFLGALSLGGCATATVVDASWRTVPDGKAMGDAYPGFAADAGVEGQARLKCTAGVDGKLSDCVVTKVRPEGLGFDAAALSLTDRFEAAPKTRDGVAVPTEVAFRITFALPPDEIPADWTGAEPSPEHLALAREIAPRFAPRLSEGPNAYSLDGLAANRVEAVQAMFAQVERELRPDGVEAVAWAMARTVPEEALRMLAVGNRRPPRPNLTDAQLASAGDRTAEVQRRANARLRSLYCARYAC